MSNFMNFRLKLFTGHLVFSFVMAIFAIFMVFYVWYPGVLSSAIGVSDIFLLMLGVDIILGPILTLILAKKGKKGLGFDLTVVLSIQLSAFLYGIYNIAISRPAWLVFYVDSFDAVQVNTLQPISEVADKMNYQSAGWLKPRYVYVPAPKGDDERTERITYSLQTGYGPTLRPNMFQSLDNLAWQEIATKQKKLRQLKELKKSIDLAEKPYSQATGWVPLRAYITPKTVLVNTDNNTIVGLLDINPYVPSN